MRLYSTTCHTDWKGRPSHSLKLLGEGTEGELLKLMDADVERWQAIDIRSDNEIEVENAKDENREPSLLTAWRTDFRWEMDRQQPTDPRVFAERYEDGGFCSTVYHIVE